MGVLEDLSLTWCPSPSPEGKDHVSCHRAVQRNHLTHPLVTHSGHLLLVPESTRTSPLPQKPMTLVSATVRTQS